MKIFLFQSRNDKFYRQFFAHWKVTEKFYTIYQPVLELGSVNSEGSLTKLNLKYI